MNAKIESIRFRYALSALPIVLLCACALQATQTAAPIYYSLDPVIKSASGMPAPIPETAPTLLIAPMQAAAGFDSTHIMYTRLAHQPEYFAHSLWIDTPARMITPLMASQLANSGAFLAVTSTTSAVAGDLRLNTELVRLEHDFSTQPAQMRFTLRATVLDNATRKVLAWSEFDEQVPSASDAPYDGINAANSAVQAGLQELAVFCVQTAQQWQIRKNADHGALTETPPGN